MEKVRETIQDNPGQKLGEVSKLIEFLRNKNKSSPDHNDRKENVGQDERAIDTGQSKSAK